MAIRTSPSPYNHRGPVTFFPRSNTPPPRCLLIALAFLAASAIAAATVRAQLQQPFVYTTGGAIAIRNDSTGTLIPTSASPLSVLGFPAVIDAKGRFLFAAGNDSIHMYQVDATTGSYTEVTGSPFFSGNSNGPVLLATEPTGTYLAVVNATGLNPGESSVESFQINATAETLTPVLGSFLELVSTPVGAAANPTLGKFFVYLGPNSFSTNRFYQLDGELLTYTIDPVTGLLGNQTGAEGSTNLGRSFGADPLGRFVVTGQGQLSGILQVTSAAGDVGQLNVGGAVFPQDILVAPGQRFVYATLFSAPNRVVHIYIVDTTTWTLTESPSSPLPGFTSVANFVADPTGQFVYQSTAPDQVRVYSVDLATGYLTEIVGSPFTAPGLGLPIAFSVSGAIQPEVGPVATLTPSTGLTFASTLVGTPDFAQIVTLSSTGNQALSVDFIKVTGPNAGDFTEADNCGVPTVLQPTNSCFISILFTPSASGGRLAQLDVADNAPGSPQSVPLTGTGVGAPPPAPTITFVPGTMNFPSTVQGSTSSPLSVTVTNLGNAPLNISSIALGGSNPTDFSAPSGNCIGAAIAPSASCTATESFTPSATGLRQATLTFTDNAAGSPHSINVTGTATAAPPAGPVLRFSPSPIVVPPTTQGLASVPIGVTINNSGTAPMHITNISAGGNSPVDFVNSLGNCNTATIAPSASCTVTFVFAPVFSGPRSESIVVSDDAPGSPQVLNIVGNADPAFTITAGSLTATVTAGQTATYTLQLTPGVDYNGVVSFTCTGAPLGASCKAPPTVILNIAAPATYSVTVPTSGKSAAVVNFNTRKSPRAPNLPLALAEEILALVFVGMFCFSILLLSEHAAGQRLRPSSLNLANHQAACALAALLLFVPIISAIQGCGGASSAPLPQGNQVVTPSGISILVLTPSANSNSGKALQLSPIQLTLIVN
ncbi:MAG: choice-of-anchor D domain-containing protein [Acidobacteriota bacterium]|nr:choice-of-anchor D domain-containing protein [Acidobacteriota bacterium]